MASIHDIRDTIAPAFQAPCIAPAPQPARPPRHIGLLAGWGRFPHAVAAALREQGHRVSCLGIRHHADPALAELCDHFAWVGMARLGSAIRYYRRRGVSEAIMAGKVHKVTLYHPGAWVRYFPDLRTVRTFYPHFVRKRIDQKDDTLLGAIVRTFGEEGIVFHPATDYVPELLVKQGCLSFRRPTAAESRDIEFGWRLAKEIGRLDVGQSVVVKDRAPLAIEAIEGTDECIRRAGQLCRKGGFTVVKVAKPQQDMRFDVPTIGLGTLETIAASGGRVLAVEAGRTIIIDQAQVIEFARRHGIAVVALEADECGAWQAASPADVSS